MQFVSSVSFVSSVEYKCYSLSFLLPTIEGTDHHITFGGPGETKKLLIDMDFINHVLLMVTMQRENAESRIWKPNCRKCGEPTLMLRRW